MKWKKGRSEKKEPQKNIKHLHIKFYFACYECWFYFLGCKEDMVKGGASYAGVVYMGAYVIFRTKF